MAGREQDGPLEQHSSFLWKRTTAAYRFPSRVFQSARWKPPPSGRALSIRPHLRPLFSVKSFEKATCWSFLLLLLRPSTIKRCRWNTCCHYLSYIHQPHLFGSGKLAGRKNGARAAPSAGYTKKKRRKERLAWQNRRKNARPRYISYGENEENGNVAWWTVTFA